MTQLWKLGMCGMSGDGTAEQTVQPRRCIGLRLAVPVRCLGDVHACRLRHAGDGQLPCEECLQRPHEELGERDGRNAWVVGLRMGPCLWQSRNSKKWLHRNRRILWHRLLHDGCYHRRHLTSGIV